MKIATNRFNFKNLLLIPIVFLFIFQASLFLQENNKNYFNLNTKCPMQISELAKMGQFSEEK